MKKIITVMAMVIALALSALAPALANGHLEKGNWLSGVATPVELQPGDIVPGALDDGTEFVTVNHQIVAKHGAYDTLVQREPARYRQNVVTADPENFNSAWLGIAGPQGPEIAHKGQMTWYYNTAEDGWVSLTFQFNGKGELLHVNGVSPE